MEECERIQGLFGEYGSNHRQEIEQIQEKLDRAGREVGGNEEEKSKFILRILDLEKELREIKQDFLEHKIICEKEQKKLTIDKEKIAKELK
jgi:CII-binding regulator of phage lambda lysogenization HflD